ncbi:MAG: methylmalonyl-CoA/ethylmalonyl-CoA epimerase [Candidatus Binatota bacterium]|nr:methylmalonyl-CoA/ethylmalonyl-CoA epimerase [Candidatus Binatota bacterium]
MSIAVREIDRALAFFLHHFPARPDQPKRDGYDGSFRWADFTIGDFKIELIESAQPGSFVDRFLAKRGEGLHHWSFDVDRLDPIVARLEADGRRIVDRFDHGDGRKTAFVHPRSAFGTLIQFWQTPEAERTRPSWGGIVEKHGTRWRADHLSIAVERLDPAVAFFRRHFGAVVETPRHLGYDQSFALLVLRVGEYRLELMESARRGSFLERFLARRGPAMHHLSIDVEDLDRATLPLERSGVQIVDRAELAAGWRTAFVHPRSAFGTLIQFWQTPATEWARKGGDAGSAPAQKPTG